MLLFGSEDEAGEWCREHRRGPGALVELPRLRHLAALWYGDRLQADWRPRSGAESQAILDRVGLTGDFWRLT
jgi:hypothetical protein